MSTIKVQVDGVGVVELDASFKDLSEDDRQATLREIAQHARGGGLPRGASTRAVLEANLKDAFPGIKINGGGRSVKHNAEVNGATNGYHLDDMALDFELPKGVTMAQVKKAMADRGVPLNEALAHDKGSGFHGHIAWDGQGGNPKIKPPEAAPEEPKHTSRPQVPSEKPAAPKVPPRTWKQTIGDAIGDLSDNMLPNWGDEVYAGGAALHALIDGEDVGAEFKRAQKRFHDNQAQYDKEHNALAWGTTLGGMGIGLAAPGGTAMKGGSMAMRLGRGAALGATYGGLAGAGDGDSLAERGGNAATGAVVGGALGGALTGVVPGIKLAKEAHADRFVKKYIKKRGAKAAFDAENVEDLVKLAKDRAPRTEGRAKLTVGEINSIETGHRAKFDDLINGLDIPKSKRLKLKEALVRRQSIGPEELADLESVPGGKAVTDAIKKVQSLRDLTPELKVYPPLIAKGADLLNRVPGVSMTARIAKAALGAGTAEKARVHAADKLIKKADLFKRIQSEVGPSGARESKGALWNTFVTREAEETAAAKAEAAAKALKAAQRVVKPSKFERQMLQADIRNPVPSPFDLAQLSSKRAAAKAAAFSEKAPAKLADFDTEMAASEANRRVSIKNDKDNIIPGGGFRGYVHEQTGLAPQEQDIGALEMLKNGDINGDQFRAFLRDPKSLMKDRTGLAIIDRLNANKELPRNPEWTPPDPSKPSALSMDFGVDAKGNAIRSPIGFFGGMLKNVLAGTEKGKAPSNMVGSPPSQGVAPANIGADGKIYVGPAGSSHFEVMEAYPHMEGQWTGGTGFVTPDGKFLNREEALTHVSKQGESIKPSENMGKELDAMDYRDQSRVVPPPAQRQSARQFADQAFQGNAPNIDLPNIGPVADPGAVPDMATLTANFEKVNGRPFNPKSLEDFNLLFGIKP